MGVRFRRNTQLSSQIPPWPPFFKGGWAGFQRAPVLWDCHAKGSQSPQLGDVARSFEMIVVDSLRLIHPTLTSLSPSEEGIPVSGAPSPPPSIALATRLTPLTRPRWGGILNTFHFFRILLCPRSSCSAASRLTSGVIHSWGTPASPQQVWAAPGFLRWE